MFVQECLLVGRTDLDVVSAFDIGERSTQASICQCAILSDRLLLNRREIVKKIWTWIIVVLIAADEASQGKHRMIAQQSSPRRGDVERLDLRSLIGYAK